MLRRAFTLIELLVVIGVIAVLLAILLPALSKARQLGSRTQCLSNIRQLQIAQIAYAAEQEDLLVVAGDGTEHGSWIGLLQPYGAVQQVRRCPDDRSVYYEQPIPGTNPPRKRTTSYGINNHVSPTHAPFGVGPIRKLTQVTRSSTVVQLVELAETGPYAGSDHIHVQDFHLPVAPQVTISLIDKQMPLGRHGGKPASWDAVLNFSFIDGHTESMAIRQVYVDTTVNLFDPNAATP